MFETLGVIPSTVGSLTQLQYLYLDTNSFSGKTTWHLLDVSVNIAYFVGVIPDSICQLGSLNTFQVTSGGNTGITCAPACVSSIPIHSTPSTVCPTNQEISLCGLIAATNIQSITGYSQWSCTTFGHTSTVPCNSPVWPGLICSGGNPISMSVNGLGISGIEIWLLFFV